MTYILLCAHGLLGVDADSRAKPKVAVLPLQPKRVSPQTVEVLDSLLVSEVDRLGDYEVIGANDLNAMLGLERMRDAAGCTDVVCAAEIGGALGTRYLLSGSVAILGNELLVQIALTDVKRVKVLRRGQAAVEANERLYRRAIQVAVADLLGLAVAQDLSVPAKNEKTRGPSFQFHTTESEFAFKVVVSTSDGNTHRCAEAVTIEKQCLLLGLVPGTANLSIVAPPLTAFADVVDIDDDEEVSAIRVLKQPSPGSILMWTFGGVAAAGGAAMTATGTATDIEGLVYGGVPSLTIGIGLLVWGFFFDGMIVVDYPGIDFFFRH